MSETRGYYRQPTIHRDSVVFLSEDDLWTVPTRGGTARRLTSNPGRPVFPILSPDGALLAYTGRDDGPTEVYVMDAGGGEPTRVTWFGCNTITVGWCPDGSAVVVATDRGQPFRFALHLWEVPLDRSPPRPVRLGPAGAISWEPAGAGVVIGRNSGDPARWKRYRGGRAGTIWVDRAGNGDYRKLLDLPGNLASPMWIGSRIYFLSDHEGIGNLYSTTKTGRTVTRHTNHEDFYVRFPRSDGRRIVYHAGADLHVFDLELAESTRVDIRIASSRPQRNRKFVPADRYLEDFRLHPEGHSLVGTSRGGVYTMGLWEGTVHRRGRESAIRYRLARWMYDGKSLVAVTDEGGEESIVLAPAGSRKHAKQIEVDMGRPVAMEASPTAAKVAIINHRNELLVVDLDSGKAKTLERSTWGGVHGIAWSPDGRWLAYGFQSGPRNSTIHVAHVRTGRVRAITRPDFSDGLPAWDPKGRYLYFLSWRVFDPVRDAHYFELGFPKGSIPLLVTLKTSEPSPFSDATRAPRPPGTPAGNAQEPRRSENGPATDGSGVESKHVNVDIDFAEIEDRVVAFPVGEGRYRQIVGTPSRVLFTSVPVEGSLHLSWPSSGPPEASGRVDAYEFDENKVERIFDGVTSITISANAKTLGLRVGNRVRVVSASAKKEATPLEPGSTKSKPGRKSGWVDLGRWRVSVEPVAEWRQMYREAWRLQRDQFWTPDMSGVDWVAIHDRYLTLLDRVASRAEFSDLVWEMQGELGTSHCYEIGGDYRRSTSWQQGFLGADVEWDEASRAWLITRIPRGDSWNLNAVSPLTAPGLSVAAGDEIVAVGGEPVSMKVSPHERLLNLARQPVELTLRTRKGKRRVNRRVVVTTLAQEYSLRYRDWVETNRTRVHDETDGRVGYVHIPDMGPRGFSEFHRYYLAEVNHEGLIVDVRWNGGGNVSQLLLQRLRRRRIAYGARRWGQPTPYPFDAPMGPMVALTNENAGSDGDIFSHSFKLLGLGPLIGKRTWGGVIGISPRHALVDGTVTTQPEFAFWFTDEEWGVENYGTDPDINVEIRPQDHAAGRDPQIERGLSEVMKLVRQMKPTVPALDRRPTHTRPRLGKS